VLSGRGSAVVITISFTLATAVLQPMTSRAADDRPRDGWNAQAAATYLDARMDMWFTNATKLRTGDGRVACLSCHTPMPYALARPALRRFLHDSKPTPQESRLVDETTRRVATYASHQQTNEQNDDKKRESRGTEAVLNALVLATAAPQSAAWPNAIAELWSTQRADGAWDWLNFSLEPFETTDAVYQGAAFAAFALGSSGNRLDRPVDQEHLGRLRGLLSGQFKAQSLYNRTWALLASSRLSGVLTSQQRDGIIADLRRAQRADGGWSLSDLGPWRWSQTTPPFVPPEPIDTVLTGRSDGYATGLVVYALRRTGAAPMDEPVRRGLDWLRSNQGAVDVGDGHWQAWRAHSLNVDREHGGSRGEPWRRLFMSDAATAFAVLALTAD
jgi:squalene-hopene/tetraprenyl-beta-curcumene cyclase